MSMKTIKEVDIWTGIINPDRRNMDVPEAQAVLRWSFTEDAKSRMEELADRNGQDELSDSEREELEAYINVGQVIGILQAKARLSLKRSSESGTA